MAHNHVNEFIPVNIAILTVPDTRTDETDTSGHLLVDYLQAAGHQLVEKAIVKDNNWTKTRRET